MGFFDPIGLAPKDKAGEFSVNDLKKLGWFRCSKSFQRFQFKELATWEYSGDLHRLPTPGILPISQVILINVYYYSICNRHLAIGILFFSTVLHIRLNLNGLHWISHHQLYNVHTSLLVISSVSMDIEMVLSACTCFDTVALCCVCWCYINAEQHIYTHTHWILYNIHASLHLIIYICRERESLSMSLQRKETFCEYRACELKHGRVAMMAPGRAKGERTNKYGYTVNWK